MVVTLKPRNRLGKLIVPIILVVMVLSVINFQPEIARGGRHYSVDQIVLNFKSLFTDVESRSLTGTMEWRLEWWGMIIDYTVFGELFWVGRGYGVNLALADGFAVDRMNPNRNPHNGHLTILARSGVPGIVFWFILQGTILIVLLRNHFAAKRAGMPVLANVNLWLLAYWVASIVNMSFDVYLEGPQGGIWFWCLIGYIIALTLSQDALMRQHAQVSPEPSGARA